MHQLQGSTGQLHGYIKRLRVGYAITSVAISLIIAWLSLYSLMPTVFYISEHPNTLFILMLANAIGLVASWYQASGYFKLASINRRYSHGKLGITLLVITWLLAVSSTVIYYLSITIFVAKGFYFVWPVPNPVLADLSLALAISSFITTFPATYLLTKTLYRLGNDLEKRIIKVGAVLLAISALEPMLLGIFLLIVSMVPSIPVIISSLESSMPIRIEIPLEILTVITLLITGLPPITGLAGTTLLAIGLKIN
ncbi:MAG: hypothetical protein ACP5L5_10700 [Vulcanisaeta sp.]|uniref:hypothetical protein n=1 Tax=Vulcanisaeta sp. TaxID=2020871 RepID=UPI003D1074EC